MKSILTFLLIAACSLSFAQNKKDSQGRKQGVWKKPYQDVQVYQYVGQFKDDKPVGEFIYYYKSGNVQSKITFLKGGTSAYNKMYHESSGRLMAQGKYVNQLKDSLWLYYDNVGNLKSQEKFVKGKLEGQSVTYYEPKNGRYVVAKYEYYKNGVRDGQFKEYHQYTKLKVEGTYKDGNKNGMVKNFYPNGKIRSVERYKFAVKHGWWVFYGKDGREVGKELFWEGKKLKDGPEKNKRIEQLKLKRK